MYNSKATTLTVTRPGVYLYEVKVQTADYKSAHFYVDHEDSEGNVKRSYYFYIDWEIAPNFLFLNMKAGDKLVHKTLDSSDINDHLLGTQFHLRFLSTYEEPQNIIDMEVDPTPSFCDENPFSWVCIFPAIR
ncbi:hypothetical protein BaRGS_00037539 [Batillaria attramentaria]|uniref:Uncharacterized protein n=1 Tax=Batillaria attramentaria TaxID=370345 RepID=A0ABD0J8C4_9CAEN